MTFWLKMIGTWAKPWDEGKPYPHDYIGFRGRKPSGIKIGDKLVLYAVGGSKRLFALVEVVSEWQMSGNKDWPFLVKILPPEVNLAPSAGVDASQVSTDLTDRIRRMSHIRLSQAEYDLAAGKLRAASKGKPPA